MEMNNLYKRDCKYFRGDIPCVKHKQLACKCYDCNFYTTKKDIILIIKLGAIGDVIRTTPLLHTLWNKEADSAIWWLTYTPDILPDKIDKILPFTLESIVTLQSINFKYVINLDKDYHACGLTNQLKADKKFGFHLVDGKPAAINELAEHKFVTGIFDDANKANTKSYLEEIFEMCSYSYNKEEYILDCDSSIKWNYNSQGKKIIGLNTGCGERWTSRLWKEEYWIELINLLLKNDYYPILLGGKQEHEKNSRLADITNAQYLGYFSLKEFISLVNTVDLVVTAVTMGLHIAIGLKKNVVLMNNIFNPYEFELYNKGIIVMPEKQCKCFFSPKCKNDDYFCMDSLYPEIILNAVNKLLK